MVRKFIYYIGSILLLSGCAGDPEPRILTKEDLYGTWVYQNVSTYTELDLNVGDTWEELQSQVPGDTSTIGGGIWSLEDSTVTVTFIGSIRLERIVKVIEVDEDKLIWQRNGNTTTLLAK